MKILQIVPSYKPAYVYGGPIESVAKLCEGIAAEGHTLDVFTTTANGKTELEVTAGEKKVVDGVNVTYFERITKDHTHISPALWRRLFTRVKEYDIVHIQSWWSPLVIIAACICHLKGAKVIISPRGMLSNYVINSGSSRAKKLIHKFIGRYALSKAVFHATAQSEYEECMQIIPGWKGFVLPNILTLPDIPVQKQINQDFSLIFLSRIHPKKGLELLFEALSKTTLPISLKIAGDGDADYVTQLQLMADELNISDKIKWIGWKSRDEKFTELMQSDLFVLISRNENFANVVVESLHMGTPVLVSKEVALSDFVNQTDMGWVCERNVEDVVLNLEKAFNDKIKQNRIHESGRTVIDSHFSSKRLINSYLEEYRKVLINS